MLKKIFRFILKQKHYISSDSYISFLKSKGIKIGNDGSADFPGWQAFF